VEEPEQLPAMLDAAADLRDGRPMDVDHAMVQPRIGPDHTVLPPGHLEGLHRIADNVLAAFR
jgi:hypothetical protein